MIQRRDILRLAAAGGAMAFLQHCLAAERIKPGMRRIGGDVRVNGQTARVGTLIRPGDIVTTGTDAEATYVVGDNAFLQRADSAVRFGADKAADFLRVVTGGLLSVFGRGNRQLAVGTATIGIRGTGCYIEEHPERTYFCLCYGEAEVIPTAAQAQRKVIRTRHHDQPIYIHADAAMPTSMVPAGVVNHSDAELTLIESLVGRKPPFGGRSPAKTHSY